MRKIILAFVYLCLAIPVTAQKQGNIWYFGYQAGLDFNTNPPTPIVGYTGLSSSQEGTACISDSSGKLLFYSDGIKLLNSRHLIMVNGTINGNNSSVQSSIIVPKPGSDSLFYVFTSDAQEFYAASSPSVGYNYSIVNMCLDYKNADTVLGAIIAAKANIHVADSGTEKLCASSDGSGGYWILGHKMYSDAFVAWHLTNTGVSSPVVTRIGPSIGVKANGTVYGCIGQMKFNAAGTKVATVNRRSVGKSSTLDLFDFNPTTGQLSNHCQTILSNDSVVSPLGLEFSPNGSKIFVSYLPGANLLQFTLTNCAGLPDSRDTIFRSNNKILYGIQAATDGKVYVGSVKFAPNAIQLNRINNPDGPGLTFDTGVYNYGTGTGNFLPYPPSFVAGYKYHNKACKCSPPLSVLNLKPTDDFQIFPNPADNYFAISTGTSSSVSAGIRLSITNCVGDLVFQSAHLPTLVETKSLATGLYFYHIYLGGALLKSGKFSVVH